MLIQECHILQIILWSSFTALLSLFLNVCMREGMILGWWLDGLADLYLEWNDPKLCKRIRNKTDGEIELMTAGLYKSKRDYKFSEVKWLLFKPLGYCIICMNVWVSIFFTYFTGLNFIEVIFYILFSNFLVRLFHERVL